MAKLTFDALPSQGPRLRAEAARWRANRMRPMYVDEFAHPKLASKHGLDRTYIVEVPPGSDTAAMARAFHGLRNEVEFASVDTIGTIAGEFIPNDPSFSFQWALRNNGQFVGTCSGGSNGGMLCHIGADCPGGSCVGRSGTAGADIDATFAWDIHTGIGGEEVIVAVVDSGVATHSELTGRMVPGRNTYSPFTPTLTTDECGHGTHVAGIIGALGHNNLGVAGVNWGVKIMPVRILGSPLVIPPCGDGTVTSLVNGMTWAADNGAHIINMSLQYCLDGSAMDRQVVQDAADYATDLGVVLIAATGNNLCGAPTLIAYPAKSRNTFAIGGTNSRDQRATATSEGWTSNYGPELDLVAPGDRVYSLARNNGFAFLSGTSMSTPHVSGLVSLLKSHAPELTRRDLYDILITTTKDLGLTGWDAEYGFGRINAFDAITLADAWPIISSSIPGNYAIDAGQPTDSLGFFEFGWDSVEVFLPPDVVAGVTTKSFYTGRKGVSSTLIPAVIDVAPAGPDSVIVYLDGIIDRFAWTTVFYEKLGAVTIGFLPGDVNADLISNADDVVSLIAALPSNEERLPPLPSWSTDLDRSGLTAPLDLLTCLDLLNGADAHDKFIDKTLPSIY